METREQQQILISLVYNAVFTGVDAAQKGVDLYKTLKEAKIEEEAQPVA